MDRVQSYIRGKTQADKMINKVIINHRCMYKRMLVKILSKKSRDNYKNITRNNYAGFFLLIKQKYVFLGCI